MSALDEYRKYNEYLAAHPTAELEARRYIDLADAAIAELEAELKVAKKLHADKCDQHMEEHTARLRAEKARAATIEVLNDCQAEMGRQCARADKAEAENERLRVCGTCGNTDDPDTCVLCGGIAEQHDACHFTPSRWTPYWEER